MANPTQECLPKIRACTGTWEYCTKIRDARARKLQHAAVSATYQNCGSAESSDSRRKTHCHQNKTDAKADFSRVYFQNVRLLLDGAVSFSAPKSLDSILSARGNSLPHRIATEVAAAAFAAEVTSPDRIELLGK
jgi:hypothetical protein